MLVSKPTPKTCRIEFADVSELHTDAALPPLDAGVTRLELVEAKRRGDLPEPAEEFLEPREIDLSRVLARFPALTDLFITADLTVERLEHPNLAKADLDGAIGFARLAMPQLRELRFGCPSSAHAANDFEACFSWLFDPELPALTHLDLRPLAGRVEWSKSRPSFIERWASAPVVRRLRYLGLPGYEITPRALKKMLPAFAHLDALVVHGLTTANGDEISAAEKNPVGGNVIPEVEFFDVPLDQVRAAAEAVPKPEHLVPSLGDDALESLRSHLLTTSMRFQEGALTKMIRPFCQKRQWDRVTQLLALAEKKAPNRRAYMNVREAVQWAVAKALAKRPDPVGQALHDRLAEENRL